MKNSYFLSIVLLGLVGRLFGAAGSSAPDFPCIVAVGGQNTLGSEADYVSALLGVPEYTIIRSPLPQGWIKDGIDLGQDVCMRNLATVFPAEGDVIFHATSQGTATTLNYVSTLPVHDQSRIKAIILEAVLGSGNSAIMHNAKHVAGSVVEAPGCGYSAPYCATSLFPRYSPSGKQAIKSIESITRDIPIVIVHSKLDGCLPYSDACALYYGLRSQGHENVYFISCEGYAHVRILEYESDKQDLLRKILMHHDVLKRMQSSVSISSAERAYVQPEIGQYREIFEALRSRERNHSLIPWAVGAATLYGVYRVAQPRVMQFCADRGIDSLQALLGLIRRS